MTRYYARSASDKTDDWPYWFVADSQRGGLNVTAETGRDLKTGLLPGCTLLPSWDAVKQAQQANKKLT